MNFREGDFVTRISHNHDIVFKIVSIEGGVAFLKGVDLRLYADSSLSDLVKASVPIDSDQQILEKNLRELQMDRSQYFYFDSADYQWYAHRRRERFCQFYVHDFYDRGRSDADSGRTDVIRSAVRTGGRYARRRRVAQKCVLWRKDCWRHDDRACGKGA